MKGLRVLPLLLCGLVASVVGKVITTAYTPNGPVTLSNAGTLSTFTHTCGSTTYLVASTSQDGATLNFPFTGTGITVTLLTDTDRGKYTIFIDNAVMQTVSGITSTQTCTDLYTVNQLPYGNHQFTLQTNTQSYGTTGGTSAKLEFIYFSVVVPDSTPTPTPTSTPTIPLNQSQSDAISGGTIAAIVIACLLVLVVALLGYLLYRAHHQIVALSNPQHQSPAPLLFSPHSAPHTPYTATSPGMSMYSGHPEVMHTMGTPPISNQPRQPGSPTSGLYAYSAK